MNEEFLWIEKYRPHTVADTILTDELRVVFQQFINQKNVPNLILAGRAGIGKTTVAKAILDELECNYLIINGSMYGNIDTLRTTILRFASTVSLTGGRKYIILDEADYLNPNSTQPALRNFMEEFSANCGFILTCNFKNKIIEPLHSRCSVIDFKISNADKPKVAIQFLKKITAMLTKENIPYEKSCVVEIIMKYFPDMRRVINELQKYSFTGKIDSGILVNLQDATFKSLIEAMKKKDFTTIRTWVAENSDIDSSNFYRKLYDTAATYFTTAGVAQLVLILGKYQYQESFVADRDINIAAMCVEIMVECDFK